MKKIKYTSFIVVCLSMFIATHYLVKGAIATATTVVTPYLTLKQPIQIFEVKGDSSYTSSCGTGSTCDLFGRNLGTTSGFIFSGPAAKNPILTYWSALRVFGAPTDKIRVAAVDTGEGVAGYKIATQDSVDSLTRTETTNSYAAVVVMGEDTTNPNLCTNPTNKLGADVEVNLMSATKLCTWTATNGVADVPTNATVTKGNAFIYVMFRLDVTGNDMNVDTGANVGKRIEGNLRFKKTIQISSI